MNDLKEPVDLLKGKIEQLIALHQQLKKSHDSLETENIALKQTVAEQKSAIEVLEKEKQTITENNNNEQEKIITDSKIKIDELVQEIDNCIALLK